MVGRRYSRSRLLAVLLLFSSGGAIGQVLVGESDSKEFVARAGEKKLRVDDIRAEAELLAEESRYARLTSIGRYRFELFYGAVREREAWLDEQTLAIVEADEGVAAIPKFIQLARTSGAKSLTPQEIDQRESYLGELRQRLKCKLDVPPFRVRSSKATAPRRGNPAAPVVVVEFIDLRCAACAALSAKIERVLKSYSQSVSLEDRHFALSSRSGESFRMAEGALCAGEQGRYWEFRDLSFSNMQLDRPVDEGLVALATDARLDLGKFRSCITSGRKASEVIADQEDGASLGVYGTPTVFVNGRRILGGEPEAALRQFIDLELEGRLHDCR